MRTERKLESNSFNTYPHYVFATAFLVNGELADYKISDRETNWGLRTFRGEPWENEVWKHGFIDKVVNRKDMKETLYKLILLHKGGNRNGK